MSKDDLSFSPTQTIKLRYDVELRRLMHAVYVFRKQTTGWSLGQFYGEAFARYLDKNKIPRQVERVDRQSNKIQVDTRTLELLEGLKRIATKRQQSVSVVIEEALKEYLAEPENYLGRGMEPKTKIKRIV